MGELDEQLFLFREYLDWCLRLWHAGCEVRWWPKVAVRHGHIERSAVEWPRITIEGIVARDQSYRKHRPGTCAQGHRLLPNPGRGMELALLVAAGLLFLAVFSVGIIKGGYLDAEDRRIGVRLYRTVLSRG